MAEITEQDILTGLRNAGNAGLDAIEGDRGNFEIDGELFKITLADNHPYAVINYSIANPLAALLAGVEIGAQIVLAAQDREIVEIDLDDPGPEEGKPPVESLSDEIFDPSDPSDYEKAYPRWSR